MLVVPGQPRTFPVEATASPETGPLRYIWFLNGEKQAEGAQWTYRPEIQEVGNQPKEVLVVVRDRDSRTAEKRWPIRITSLSARIDGSTPSTAVVKIEAGGSQKFHVQVSKVDPSQALALLWFLDSDRVADGEVWEFKAPTSEGPHRVAVELRDQTGVLDQRSWDVRVFTSRTGRLAISQVSPMIESEREFTIGVGQRQIFTFKAESPEQRALSYSWFLDGIKRGEGTQFVYRPRPLEVRFGIRELKAVVSDDRGQSLDKLWRVRIRAAGGNPQITAVSPLNTGVITLAAGSQQGFSVDAFDPDGDELSYMWLLDGRETAQGRSWSWTPGELQKGGVHTVEVTVLDKAGLDAKRMWKVIVPASLVASQVSGSDVHEEEPATPPEPLAMQNESLVKIERAISSLATARPGDTVEFVTEYSVTFPPGIREEFVRVTWALERNGKKLGEEGMHTKMVKAGAHAASNQLALPSYMKPGRYAVAHKVQVGDSYGIARSYFSVVPN